MWPFDGFRRRAFERRFNAALLVLLGHYGFRRLNEHQRTLVDDRVASLSVGTTEPVAAHRRDAAWDVRAAYRGVSMALLDVQPELLGLRMRSFLPSHFMERTLPVSVVYAFSPIGAATEEAKNLLRSRGFDIPDESPWEAGTLDPVDGSGYFWKVSGLREVFEKRREASRRTTEGKPDV